MKIEDTVYLVGLVAAGAAAAAQFGRWRKGAPAEQPADPIGQDRPQYRYAPPAWTASDADDPTRKVRVELLAPPRETPMRDRQPSSTDAPF